MKEKNMCARIIHSQSISKTTVYYVVLVLIFIMCGLHLKAIPFFTNAPLETTVTTVGTMKELFRNGNGINQIYSLAFPYGIVLSESFLVYYLAKFFDVLRFSTELICSLCYFTIYTLSFFSMVGLVDKVTDHNQLSVCSCTLLFFLDPFLMSDKGLIGNFLGFLMMPVISITAYQVYEIIKKKQKPRLIDSIKVIAFTFVSEITISGLGWYPAVICACGVCIFLLLYSFSVAYHRKDSFAIVKYLIFCITPWLMAMGLVFLITPSSVTNFHESLEFYNGSSVDAILLLLPNKSQLISNIFPSVQDVFQGKTMLAEAEQHFAYLGYILVICAIISCFSKKIRSKEIVCLILTFTIGLILSLGPGLKWMGTTEMMGYQAYLYPLDRVVLFPWAQLYTKLFPLNMMRAVYRWMLIPKFALLIIFALFLRVICSEKKICTAVILAVIALVEFLPIQIDIASRDQPSDVKRIEESAISELKWAKERLQIQEDETAVFMTYDLDQNAFLSPILNNAMGTNCYTGAGDKAILTAYPYSPAYISRLTTCAEPDEIASMISVIRQYRVCSFVVFPFFDLRLQSYFWPATDSTYNRCKNIAEQVVELLEDYPYLETENFLLVDLRTIPEVGEKQAETLRLINRSSLLTEIDVDDNTESIYFYAMGIVDQTEDGDNKTVSIEILEDDGSVYDRIRGESFNNSNSYRFEKEIPVTKGHTYTFYSKKEDDSEVVLTNTTISTVDRDSFFVGEKKRELINIGFEKILEANNVIVDNETVVFQGNSMLSMEVPKTEEITYLSFSLDLTVADNTCFSNTGILTIWKNWKQEMTVCFGLKEEKSFIGVSEDGVDISSIWFDNSYINDHLTHSFFYEFDHGTAKLMIDNKIISETELPYRRLYKSEFTNLEIGRGLKGDVSNFSICYS